MPRCAIEGSRIDTMATTNYQSVGDYAHREAARRRGHRARQGQGGEEGGGEKGEVDEAQEVRLMGSVPRTGRRQRRLFARLEAKQRRLILVGQQVEQAVGALPDVADPLP
jgi:hypothetical protein